MISKRETLLRLGGVAAVYAALMVAYPFVAAPFSAGLAIAGDLFLHRPGWDARASFRPALDERGEHISITVTHPGSQQQGVTALGVRGRCYTPLIVLISLIVISPVSWKRRLLAGGLAFPLLGIVMLASMWIVAVNAIVTWPGNAFGVSAPIPAMFKWLYFYAAGVPMTVIVVPLVLWGACTFRRGDFAAGADARPPE